MAKRKRGVARAAVGRGTGGRLTPRQRVEVTTALERFKRNEQLAGRSLNRADISRIQRELEASVRRVDARRAGR